jgi:hypothetical protein
LYDNSFEFHHVEESAIEKFNLTEDKSLEGKTFKVYYKTKSFSKSDTGDLKYVIVDLELIE